MTDSRTPDKPSSLMHPDAIKWDWVKIASNPNSMPQVIEDPWYYHQHCEFIDRLQTEIGISIKLAKVIFNNIGGEDFESARNYLQANYGKPTYTKEFYPELEYYNTEQKKCFAPNLTAVNFTLQCIIIKSTHDRLPYLSPELLEYLVQKHKCESSSSLYRILLEIHREIGQKTSPVVISKQTVALLETFPELKTPELEADILAALVLKI